MEDAISAPMGAFASRRSVAVGAVWSGFGLFVAGLAGIPATAFLVRRLPVPQYGAIATANAVLALLFVAGGLGLTASTARFGAMTQATSYAKELTDVVLTAERLARRSAVALAGALFLVAAGLATVPSLRSTAWVLAISVPAAVLVPRVAVAQGFWQVVFRPRHVAMASALNNVCQLIAVLVAVLVVGLTTAWQVAGLVSIGSFVGYVAVTRGLPALPRRWRPRPSTDRTRQLLGFGLSMVVTAAAGAAISQLDVLLLGFFRGRGSAGLYAPVSLLADQTVLLAGISGSYLLAPLAAAAARGDHAEVGTLYRWSSRWGLVIAAPAIGAFLVSPSSVLAALYGPRLVGESAAVRILGAGLLVHLLFGFNGMTLDAYGLARALAVRSGVGLLVSVAACFALVPTLGAVGAATATTAAIVVLNGTCSLMLFRRYQIRPYDRFLLMCLMGLAGGAGLAWCLVTGLHLRPWPGLLAASALSLVPTAVAVLTVNGGEDMRRLQALLRRDSRRHPPMRVSYPEDPQEAQ